MAPNTFPTDHLALSFRVRISGTDAKGNAFEAQGRTLELTPHGATILASLDLVSGQAVTVSRTRKLQSASARILGRGRSTEEGAVYAISFQGDVADFWDIAFSALPQGEDSNAGRCLMQCSECRRREVIHMQVEDLQAFEVNRTVLKPCAKCNKFTSWEEAQPAPEEAEEIVPSPAPRQNAIDLSKRSRRAANRVRKFDRVTCLLTACLREGTEDYLVEVQNVSRGGVCFRSEKTFLVESRVSIALPYSRGIGNVFAPARIAWTSADPATGPVRHGAEYVKQETSHK